MIEAAFFLMMISGLQVEQIGAFDNAAACQAALRSAELGHFKKLELPPGVSTDGATYRCVPTGAPPRP